jgi:histidine ammonia-lyase
LCGEGEVWRHGVPVSAAQALADAGITPLRLRPKEGLAIMNGTAVMTALACLAYVRADYLTRLVTRITALASFALDGNARHFDATLFAVKPHPGMQRVAGWLRQDLPCDQLDPNKKRPQDRYSVRCAPHVIGVLADALPWLRESIENELNSANDNPIIDAENQGVLSGGHFYGGHIAFAMDSMKNAVANLADLLDRQMALLVDCRYNNGLPPNLSGVQGPRAAINHGLKGLQISASAWTAEALKLTMPASVFSRSTECHNQDKVSMGTIAARDCVRVLELTEQVAAALLITVRQGVWLRCRLNRSLAPAKTLKNMMDALGADIRVIEEDRRLEPDLRLLLERMRGRFWKLYE